MRAPLTCPDVWIKELNPRRRVYVEIPKPARVELKCSQNPRRFDVILATPEKSTIPENHKFKMYSLWIITFNRLNVQ
jgi:hypothetical protein